MKDIFFFLSFLSFLAMVIGTIKPSLVLPRSLAGAKPTRNKAVTVYLIATVVNMVGVIVFGL